MNLPKTPIPFQPIDFDLAKRTVDDFANERNVPTQVFPLDAGSQPAGQGAAPLRSLPPPRSPTRKFTVELPEYVIDAILRRGVQSTPKRTARYIILEALRSIGLEVKELDMVLDARRTTDAR